MVPWPLWSVVFFVGTRTNRGRIENKKRNMSRWRIVKTTPIKFALSIGGLFPQISRRCVQWDQYFFFRLTITQSFWIRQIEKSTSTFVLSTPQRSWKKSVENPKVWGNSCFQSTTAVWTQKVGSPWHEKKNQLPFFFFFFETRLLLYLLIPIAFKSTAGNEKAYELGSRLSTGHPVSLGPPTRKGWIFNSFCSSEIVFGTGCGGPCL